jgi:DNA-directed RNA polymerase specialized sigma24 family protein
VEAAADPTTAYRVFGPALVRKAERLLRSREDAVDVVHALFADLIPSWTPDVDLPYLYRAVTNRCLNLVRGVRDFPLPFTRFIAAMELLGAAGLILPRATRIAPFLTPLAAAGLGIIMVGAARAHARLHEPRNVATNIVLLALCVVVAIGR